MATKKAVVDVKAQFVSARKALEARIDKLSTEINTVENQQNALSDRVDVLYNEQSDLERLLDGSDVEE